MLLSRATGGKNNVYNGHQLKKMFITDTYISPNLYTIQTTHHEQSSKITTMMAVSSNDQTQNTFQCQAHIFLNFDNCIFF